jgi:hypothetical protein
MTTKMRKVMILGVTGSGTVAGHEHIRDQASLTDRAVAAAVPFGPACRVLIVADASLAAYACMLRLRWIAATHTRRGAGARRRRGLAELVSAFGHVLARPRWPYRRVSLAFVLATNIERLELDIIEALHSQGLQLGDRRDLLSRLVVVARCGPAAAPTGD